MTDVEFKQHLVICDCLSPEHQLLFTYDPLNEIPEIWVEFHLSQYQNIFKRVWVALRYVFGYKSRYGNWDTVCIGVNKANKLIAYLDEFITDSGEAE